MSRVNNELKGGVTHVDQSVLDCFASYAWPGNIRELENVLMKAVALSTGNVLTIEQLSPDLRVCEHQPAKKTAADIQLGSLAEVEKKHLQRVLNATAGHKGEACEILGISRPRLRRMMREYGLGSDS